MGTKAVTHIQTCNAAGISMLSHNNRMAVPSAQDDDDDAAGSSKHGLYMHKYCGTDTNFGSGGRRRR